MKQTHFAVFLSFAVVHVTAASASEHTGYWNQRTQAGNEFKCEGATSRERMEEVLKKAGWNMESVPSLDWQRDEAVVVAPLEYYKSSLLSFYGLTREGNSIVLAYGWKPIEASESVGANSASFGSVGEGYPATIVVAYRRGLDNGLNFQCRNRGVVQ